MKLFKLTILTLIVAIIASTVNTYAARDIYVYQEIERGAKKTTPTYKKKDPSNQTYTNSTTATSLTNPCANCQIAVKALSVDYGTSNTAITKMGSEYILYNSGYQDNYYLLIWRYDTTALTTKTGGTWHIET